MPAATPRSRDFLLIEAVGLVDLRSEALENAAQGPIVLQDPGQLDAADADYVAACAPARTTERAVLARAGFVPVPRLGPPLTARRLNPIGPDPSRWASWRCSIGDLELF